ncbi:hypothetical protein R1sor_003464 [Riccia sorocarpa]|uniref:Uncharacterized protein n=1 Tax=Riccia sorocarpa TaxID=122646 RepID=A0ABD3H1P0_9MARC
MVVPHTVDEVILLEKDQVPGSAGTGGSEADDGGIGSIDGTKDPEGLDPEEEGAEAGEEEGTEDEQSLGEGIVAKGGAGPMQLSLGSDSGSELLLDKRGGIMAPMLRRTCQLLCICHAHLEIYSLSQLQSRLCTTSLDGLGFNTQQLKTLACTIRGVSASQRTELYPTDWIAEDGVRLNVRWRASEIYTRMIACRRSWQLGWFNSKWGLNWSLEEWERCWNFHAVKGLTQRHMCFLWRVVMDAFFVGKNTRRMGSKIFLVFTVGLELKKSHTRPGFARGGSGSGKRWHSRSGAASRFSFSWMVSL